MAAFAGPTLRRPKLLIVTRSRVRAANIHQLAVRYFADLLPADRLGDFLEVLTFEDARRKLRAVTVEAERSAPPKEWPWVVELRTVAERDAAQRAAAEADRAAAAAAALEATERRWQAEAERQRREREEAAAAAASATGILGKLKGIVDGK